MIRIPDCNKAFEYENAFYLSCDTGRIGKFLAHFELFKMISGLRGAIVECGVFKGASFVRFAMFRSLFEEKKKRRIIGFDTFEEFPETNFEDDKQCREDFLKKAGTQSISVGQLKSVLKKKKCEDNTELVKGDITKTLPEYVKSHPRLKISMLNLDVDIYEPAATVLEYLYPKIVKGGVLLLDDYKIFPGETKAVDDYFKGSKVIIREFPFSVTPKYIIKNQQKSL